ncbi:nicotinate phosphoribosyltransferase [Demequina sp. NBRC 110053]|uniref:nicotinate phosphoribosyltransferase n=1 Tax=Demequina sp. NBRC 110053 TaxID=1570342 RepID=UPI000A069A05|nr:nicotinate phosphoribosyltransferase [Demequina sp. NBRC 110053]
MTPPDSGAAASALATDQYELTMAASYHAQGMNGPAVFDLFVRSLPESRRYLVAAGIADAVAYLEQVRFSKADVEYLRSLGTFDEAFLNYLAGFRFTGEVWAVAEGEVCFPEEPLVRVEAPLIEAQIVETALLSTVAHQTAIASKAARVAIAAGERSFVDFASRRAHGPEAAVKGARSAYLAGASATSNVLAGKLYGIPLSGTMAHSYVMAFEDEREAFRTFARDFPTSAVLLIDTYDTVQGARHAVEVARELADEGVRLRGVRLDSGDLANLSRAVRTVLDEGGCGDVRIVVSGDLDEHRIAELIAAGAPIDSFGVGTQMGVSADAPALSAVYKLAEADGRPVLKLSTGKDSLPGRKQVWRVERDGLLDHDVIGLDGEELPGRPLLEHAMSGGRRMGQAPSMADARERCERGLASLPEQLRSLEGGAVPPPVRTSAALDELSTRVRAALDDRGA